MRQWPWISKNRGAGRGGGVFERQCCFSKTLCENFNIRICSTAAESPWSNVLIERHNAILCLTVTKTMEDIKWKSVGKWKQYSLEEALIYSPVNHFLDFDVTSGKLDELNKWKTHKVCDTVDSCNEKFIDLRMFKI